MSDESTPPNGVGPEPEPGSTEWLLAQLSGGRIDSRRERREAEAALEAAGVPLPDVVTGAIPTQSLDSSEAPGSSESSDAASDGAGAAEERPRARFSWETGTLEAVDAPQQADADPIPAPAPASSAVGVERPVERAPEPTTAEEAVAAAAETASEPTAPPAFMWNLTPTSEPDPAVNPRAELPEPRSPQADFFAPSAPPLVVPRPAAQSPASAAEVPEAKASAEPSPAHAASAAREPEAPPAHAPLPPGTTAHEFDPFAQDVFPAPAAPGTPVPSVDEFTIPDEDAPAAASVRAADVAGAGDVGATLGVPGSSDAGGADGAGGTPANSTGEAAEPAEVTSDWGDIADMLGAHPQTVDTGIVSPMPPVNEILPSFDALLPQASARPPAETAPRAPKAPVEHGRGGSPLNRWLLIAAAVLLAIIIGIALFTLGRSLAAGGDQTPVAATRTSSSTPAARSAAPTPTPTPTQTQTVAPAVSDAGSLTPGQSYPWDQLRGGECINPFSSPWAQQFAVVDCNAQHTAQLVYTASYSTDPSAAFPGEAAIASQINLLCSKPGIVDLNAAAAYNDVQLVASYPVNAEQWSAGQRNYYCFVTRASGQPFSSSIAGPGPTQ